MRYLSLPKTIGISAVVIAILLIALVFKDCGGGNKAKIDAKTQKTMDSLAGNVEAFNQRKDSIIKVVIHDTVIATRVYRASTTTAARADVSGKLADSLGLLARSHADSARLWRAAYEERTREADTLKLALAQRDSAFRYEQDARIGLSILYGADTLRRIAEERVNERLVKDIAKLQQPCKVAFISCPSRVATMVVTAVVVAGAGEYLRRR